MDSKMPESRKKIFKNFYGSHHLQRVSQAKIAEQFNQEQEALNKIKENLKKEDESLLSDHYSHKPPNLTKNIQKLDYFVDSDVSEAVDNIKDHFKIDSVDDFLKKYLNDPIDKPISSGLKAEIYELIDNSNIFIEFNRKLERSETEKLLLNISRLTSIPIESFKEIKLNGSILYFKINDEKVYTEVFVKTSRKNYQVF